MVISDDRMRKQSRFRLSSTNTSNTRVVHLEALIEMSGDQSKNRLVVCELVAEEAILVLQVVSM